MSDNPVIPLRLIDQKPFVLFWLSRLSTTLGYLQYAWRIQIRPAGRAYRSGAVRLHRRTGVIARCRDLDDDFPLAAPGRPVRAGAR
jgi:hypothetical protein